MTLQEMKKMLSEMEEMSNAQAPYFDDRLEKRIEQFKEMIKDAENE